MRARPVYYCEVYMPTDRLARGPWELGIGWQAPRALHTAASLYSSDALIIPTSIGVYTSQ